MQLGRTHGLRHSTRGARDFNYTAGILSSTVLKPLMRAEQNAPTVQDINNRINKVNETVRSWYRGSYDQFAAADPREAAWRASHMTNPRDIGQFTQAEKQGNALEEKGRASYFQNLSQPAKQFPVAQRNRIVGYTRGTIMNLSGLGDLTTDQFYASGSCPPGSVYLSESPSPNAGGQPVVRCMRQPQATERAVPAQAPSYQNNPTFNVSPVIQTTVSPQVSPVFQQAFQPTGSPMTAGTTQTAPSGQNAGTAGQSAPTPTPAQQQPGINIKDVIDLFSAMNQARAPAVTMPSAGAPAINAPPVPSYTPPPSYNPPPMISSSASTIPVEAAPSVPSTPGPATAVPIVSQSSSMGLAAFPKMWWILAAAGLGAIVILSSGKKGKK